MGAVKVYEYLVKDGGGSTSDPVTIKLCRPCGDQMERDLPGRTVRAVKPTPHEVCEWCSASGWKDEDAIKDGKADLREVGY